MRHARRTENESRKLKDDIVKYTESGLSQKEVAAKLGIVSQQYVSDVLRSMGFGHTKLTKEQDEAIVARYKSGETIAKLAVFYGVSNKTIIARVRHLDEFKRREKVLRKVTDETKKEIVKFYDQEVSISAIARKVGYSDFAVRSVLKERGIYKEFDPDSVWGTSAELDLDTVAPRESFPPFDFFDLKPEHRKRLEELRQAKIKRWQNIHKKKGIDNEI